MYNILDIENLKIFIKLNINQGIGAYPTSINILKILAKFHNLELNRFFKNISSYSVNLTDFIKYEYDEESSILILKDKNGNPLNSIRDIELFIENFKYCKDKSSLKSLIFNNYYSILDNLKHYANYGNVVLKINDDLNILDNKYCNILLNKLTEYIRTNEISFEYHIEKMKCLKYIDNFIIYKDYSLSLIELNKDDKLVEFYLNDLKILQNHINSIDNDANNYYDIKDLKILNANYIIYDILHSSYIDKDFNYSLEELHSFLLERLRDYKITNIKGDVKLYIDNTLGKKEFNNKILNILNEENELYYVR